MFRQRSHLPGTSMRLAGGWPRGSVKIGGPGSIVSVGIRPPGVPDRSSDIEIAAFSFACDRAFESIVFSGMQRILFAVSKVCEARGLPPPDDSWRSELRQSVRKVHMSSHLRLARLVHDLSEHACLSVNVRPTSTDDIAQETWDAHQQAMDRMDELLAGFPETATEPPVGLQDPDLSSLPGMDKECIAICNAINLLPGLRTRSSCCGHMSARFSVMIDAQSIDDLAPLAFLLDESVAFYEWSLRVKGSLTNGAIFELVGPPGHYEQAEEIAGAIRGLVDRGIDHVRDEQRVAQGEAIMRAWERELQ